MDVSFSTTDLSLQTPRLPTADVDQGKPAQSRNTTRRAGQPRAAWLYLCGLRSIDPQSGERTRAARRPFAAVVRPAGNFVVRQLKVSRGNSRTNRWNGRRRPSGASRRATSYVCTARWLRGREGGCMGVYMCVHAQPASAEVFLRMGINARIHTDSYIRAHIYIEYSESK